jgi:hypothetical protein
MHLGAEESDCSTTEGRVVLHRAGLKPKSLDRKTHETHTQSLVTAGGADELETPLLSLLYMITPLNVRVL